MTAFSFAARSMRRSAAAVAGVTPLTSPPVSYADFDPASLTGHSFIYFKLHGFPGDDVWYGDGGLPAVTAGQLRQAKLDGAMVFAANCWGGELSPMVLALMAAGAAAVVTGTGLNYAGITSVNGADIMALTWRLALETGLPAGAALWWGKKAALFRRPRLRDDINSFDLVGQASARLAYRKG